MSVTTTDILSESLTLAEMILKSESFRQYQINKELIKNDYEAQQLIWEFNKCKDAYEEAQRFGKYHPDYEKLSKQVREKKREMDLYEPIALFKKAEKQLENILNEVSGIVAHAVSDKVKVPTGNPFFDAGGCGGGCRTGGGCGCK